MKKPTLFITTIIIIIALLSVVYVGVSNSLSTTGITLSKLQNEITSNKKENALLVEKILQVSSLTYIASKAKNKGFTQEGLEVMLPAPLPIAFRQ